MCNRHDSQTLPAGLLADVSMLIKEYGKDAVISAIVIVMNGDEACLIEIGGNNGKD